MSEKLDVKTTSLASLRTEVDAGLDALIGALTFAEKFAAFLPGSVKTELATAVTVLTSIKALVDKFA